MSLMPCFAPGQAEAEGVLVGRILAGYGELELTMAACLIAVDGEFDTPIRQIFGERGAEKRIKIARKALLNEYTKAGLDIELVEALNDMDWCRMIRNQYAHCYWYWTQSESLCFVTLEDLAKQPTHISKLMDGRLQIDAKLLSAQEQYLNHVKESFIYIENAYQKWNDRHARGIRPARILVSKPAKVARPPLHL